MSVAGRILILLGLLLPMSLFSQPQPVPSTDLVPAGSPQAGGIVDLALIYQGGTHRLPWTTEQLQPYISWKDPDTGSERWLFDGFLFIEFKDNRGWEFAEGYGQKSARRGEWEWYLNRIFERGAAVSALDDATSSTIARIGTPPRPRRVILTIPEPIAGQKDWGRLDDRDLDFSLPEDRIAAGVWFLNQLVQRWNMESYTQVELAGFYMVAERMRPDDAIVTRAIGDVARARGLHFYWIPYWNADGAADWRSLGFDVAYQQPNHFFSPEVPDDRLEQAIDFARRHGMGMEMEWDDRARTDKPVFLQRFTAYLDAFEHNSVWKTSAVAHYEGGGALMRTWSSEDPEVRAVCDRYCRILADRQQAGF